MSDRTIQAGDLVQIVKSCCNFRLGSYFTVEDITTPHKAGQQWAECDICMAKVARFRDVVALEDQRTPWPISWLKRIPPLSELEGQRTEESCPLVDGDLTTQRRIHDEYA